MQQTKSKPRTLNNRENENHKSKKILFSFYESSHNVGHTDPHNTKTQEFQNSRLRSAQRLPYNTKEPKHVFRQQTVGANGLSTIFQFVYRFFGTRSVFYINIFFLIEQCSLDSSMQNHAE